jgi:hypothetical protein
MIYHTRGEYTNHYTTNTARKDKARVKPKTTILVFATSPLRMQLEGVRGLKSG